MLIKHIQKQLSTFLGHSPTTSQKELIDKLAEFIFHFDKLQVFIINGYAGTGKTTIIKSLILTLKQFKINTLLLAPTGRAAKVITSYTGQKAYTIHKKIYRQKSSKDGFGKFELNKNLYSNTLFIVDEASMISNSSLDSSIFGTGRLLDDLIEFVFNNRKCKLILIGDEAQLPPVGIELSPALEQEQIGNYMLDSGKYTLTDVIRQSEDSGILFNASRLRKQIESNNSSILPFKLDSFTDIQSLSGEELIEKISDSYDEVGIEETVIVCRSNKRANVFNKGIRQRILWREEEISAGDTLMVVKNNYYWLDENDDTSFIANGDIMEILKVKNYEDRYGFRFANLVVRLVDFEDLELEVKIILDSINNEAASLSSDDNKRLFYAVMDDYMDENNKQKRYKKVKEDAFFNALQVKFAYAVTCHKAQGGQWKHVFLDQGYFAENEVDRAYLRWLYTGVTRAIDKLYLVNFRKEFLT